MQDLNSLSGRYYHKPTRHSIIFTYENDHSMVIDISKPEIDKETDELEPLKSIYIDFDAGTVVLDSW